MARIRPAHTQIRARAAVSCSVLPVTSTTIRLFLHILAATVWVGGQFAARERRAGAPPSRRPRDRPGRRPPLPADRVARIRGARGHRRVEPLRGRGRRPVECLPVDTPRETAARRCRRAWARSVTSSTRGGDPRWAGCSPVSGCSPRSRRPSPACCSRPVDEGRSALPPTRSGRAPWTRRRSGSPSKEAAR